MAKMNQREIQMWQARITRAEALQGEKRKERLQAIRLYTGTFFGQPTDNNTEWSEVNFLYEFVDVMTAALFSRNPHIFVRALSGNRVPFAETMEKVINYYWRDKGAKEKFKKAIKDAILQPPGFIMVGYNLLTEKNEFKIDLEREFPELKEGPGKTEEQQGILDETIKDDDVFLSHISSWEVFWPDGYHDIRQCPYIFVREKTTLEDVLNNPSIKNSKFEINQVAKIHRAQRPKNFDLKSNTPPSETRDIGATDLETIPVVLFHVWDRRSMRRFTLAQGFIKDTLKGPVDWEYLPDGFPIFPLIFNEVPQTDERANSYPLSDVVPMLPQLKELSMHSSAMLRRRKRSGSVILVEKESMSATEATNIAKASDVDIVFVDKIDRVKNFVPAPLGNDFYRLRDVILQDLMRISGMKQLIGIISGVETATESNNLREGTRVRQSQKVDIIEDLTADVARYLSGLIWQFKQDKREIEEIIGEKVTEEMWPSLPKLSSGAIDAQKARKLVQKEVLFRIDAGSTRPPKDEAVERKQFTDLATALKASFPGRFKDDGLVEQILKKFDFKDLENVIKRFDDIEQQVATQENELLSQGNTQLVSPNENHEIHIPIHGQIKQATEESDAHILMHSGFMEGQQPGIQQGKGAKSAPEIKREGVAEAVDISGGINNIRGVGGNSGGPNI